VAGGQRSFGRRIERAITFTIRRVTR